MEKEKYLIKFIDGTYLKKGTPRYYPRSGGHSFAKVEDISNARVFNDYSKAESIRADLISISFNQKCEIEIKP